MSEASPTDRIEQTTDRRHDGVAGSARTILEILASTVVLLALETSCDKIEVTVPVKVQCEATDGSTQDDNTGDGSVHCAAGDSIADGSATPAGAGHVEAALAVSGPDGSASVASTGTACFEATQSEDPQTNFEFGSQFDMFCDDPNAAARVHVVYTLTKNSDAPFVVIDATAEIDCGNGDVVADDPLDCAQTLPGRYFCNTNFNIFDVLDTKAGDIVTATLTLEVEDSLSADAPEFDTAEVEANVSAFFNGVGFTSVPCGGDETCDTDGDCPDQDTDEEPDTDTEEDTCLDDECVDLSFAESLDVHFSSSPDPITPGLAFSFTAGVSAVGDGLLPYTIVLTAPTEALDLNGPPPPPSIVLGACQLASLNFLIVTGTPGTLFIDVNANATADAEDPTVAYGDQGDDFVVTITIPSASSRSTIPADALVNCSVNSLFIAGAEGVYPVSIEAASVDLDTSGADDGAGRDPLTFEDTFDLIIGTPPPPACGDPVNLTVSAPAGERRSALRTASDALFVLRTAVGSETCLACVCDVDGNGTIAASDALITLKGAVGQQVTFSCPAC